MEQYPKQNQMPAPPDLPGMGYPMPGPSGMQNQAPHGMQNQASYGMPQVQAPYGMPQVQAPYGMPQVQAWSTGLCDCFDDVNSCCLTFWCPCITFGQIAEIVDRGNTSCGTAGAIYILIAMLTGCQWIYSCTYRQRFRMEYSLQEEPCADCLVHYCCEGCALCQMSRELKNRGWDLNLGYQMNVEKRALMAQQGVPPPMQGMMR